MRCGTTCLMYVCMQVYGLYIHVRLGKDVYLIYTILARSLGICTVSQRYDEKSRVTSLIEILFFFFFLHTLLVTENLIPLFFFHLAECYKKDNYTTISHE